MNRLSPSGATISRPAASIGLIVAVPAEGDEAIEIEIGAVARAFDHMVDVEAAAAAAGFAASPRASVHFRADDSPLLVRRALPPAAPAVGAVAMACAAVVCAV
jgi:hypothetical protein